jgi:hypothetical protein
MYSKATSLLNLYIRNIIPGDMGIPLLEHLALSGRADARKEAPPLFASALVGTASCRYSSFEGRERAPPHYGRRTAAVVVA